MRILTGCFLLVVLLLCFTNVSESKQNNHFFDRPNTCTRIESFQKTFELPKTKKIKEYFRTWCFAIPPTCTQYRWKTVTVIKNITVNQTRIAYDCCRGYIKIDESCHPFCRLGCGHGECIEPDVCLCDEGWREPYCTQECEPNRYGKGCMHNCSCMNGGTCDKTDGSCSCTEGYTGTYCEFPCPDNMYGKDCLEQCECQNGAMCDIKDGTCDCEPGFYGDNCEKVCELGSHGKDCMFECICLPDTTSTCDPVHGECICRPGYRGEFCEHECSNFTYGRNCESECDCVNSEFCEPTEGYCICKPGWTGDSCSEKCSSGTFGEDCTLKCSPCFNETATCNHVTGYCDCPPGFSGHFCETECEEGYWGSNCSKQCECSNKESCSPETGECTCPPGWILPNCSELCPSGLYGYNCSFECNCTDGNSCNATSGDCSSPLKAEIIGGTVNYYLLTIMVPSLFIFGTLVLIYTFTSQILSGMRSCVGFFSKRFGGDYKNSTSTDNIIGEHFSNPLYACTNGIEGTDTLTPGNISISISSSACGFQNVNFQTEDQNNTEEKTSNVYAECGQMTDRKSTSSNLSEPSDINDSTIGSLVRKIKTNIRNSGRKSDSSNESAIPIEDEFVPEVLGDFKIPEDNAYESVLVTRQKIEESNKEKPSE